MPKYSTGGNTTTDVGDVCELCGDTERSMDTEKRAGASVTVCSECSTDKRDGNNNRRREQNQNNRLEGSSELWDSDTSSWESEGANYSSDPLPHLIDDYATRVTQKRKEMGIEAANLAHQIGVDEMDIISVENGNAVRGDVGGSTIREIENILSVDLIEE